MKKLDKVGLYGTAVGVLMVPALGSGGWDMWKLISAGGVLAAGVGLLTWPYLLRFAGQDMIEYDEIRPARIGDVDAIHALATKNFGPNVTGKVQIKALINKSRKMFFVSEGKNQDRTTSTILGYGCIIPLSHSQHEKIKSNSFGVGDLCSADVPRGRLNIAAIYIGAVVGSGSFASGKLLGYIESQAGEQARRTRSKLVYAKAATEEGLRLMLKKGFKPVDPEVAGIGGFFKTSVN